jgi:hypothetical protein
VDGENIGHDQAHHGQSDHADRAPWPPRYSTLVDRMLTQDREHRPSELREAFATLRELTAGLASAGTAGRPTLVRPGSVLAGR